MPITAANGQTYSDDQIRNYFASSPTNDAIAKQAQSLGLNADQIAQAANIAGKSWTRNDVTNAAQGLGYNFGGANGGILSNASSQQPTSLQVGNNNYTSDQVRGWMNGKTPEQVAQQAVSMGLTQDQIRQAYQMSGQTIGANDISNYANRIGVNFNGAGGGAAYNANANAAGWNAQGGSNGMENGTLTTRGGKQVSHAQLAAFAASNPTDQQILAQAAQWGMSQSDIATALNNLGLLYNGSPTSVQMNDPKNGSIYNRLGNELYTGGLGYSPAYSANFNPNAIITTGNGHNLVDNGDGSFHWDQFGTNATPVYGNGDGTNPGGGGAVGGGVPGGGVTGGGGTGGTVTASGSSGVTPWNVTPEQTVEQRIAGILSANNPLIQQARARSDQAMNQRGLLNSSIANSAADSAAYQAALPIAQADAATFADSAKFNASAKNQFAYQAQAQANTVANMLQSADIAKDLQRATALYGNLQSQTSSANSIQNWGLQTLSSIMVSDLSPEAKNAATAQITRYMNDSYQIQGDWHTSAAQLIDQIFGK